MRRISVGTYLRGCLNTDRLSSLLSLSSLKFSDLNKLSVSPFGIPLPSSQGIPCDSSRRRKKKGGLTYEDTKNAQRPRREVAFDF
jgi:hypothetical protein